MNRNTAITNALIFFFCYLSLNAPLSAETVYRWKDELGITQFGSTPPQDREYVSIQLKTQNPKSPSTKPSKSKQLQALEEDRRALHSQKQTAKQRQAKQKPRNVDDQFLAQWLGQWDEAIEKDRQRWIEHCEHNRGTHCKARADQHHLVRSTTSD